MILVQLLAAVVCGGLIGYQREASERPAGFRTHVLVCVGSAVYMMVSVTVAGGQFDPSRIAAQVASGIGFLGAGTIIKQGSIVRGLTTAASLWAVAGIGLATGYGGNALVIAVLGTLVVFGSLSFLTRIERRMERGHLFRLFLRSRNPRTHIMTIRETLTTRALEVRGFAVQDEHDDEGEIILEGRATTLDDINNAISDLTHEPYVLGVRWEYR